MNPDQTKLQDWNLRILDIVEEMKASVGAKQLEDEIDQLESIAFDIDALIGE